MKRIAKTRLLQSLTVLAAAGCGYVTGTTLDASLGVSFFGTAPTLLPAVVQLQVQTPHRSYLYVGGVSATPDHRQDYDFVGLQGNDTLNAVLTIQTLAGVEVARVVTGLRVQSGWIYGLGFQAGGIRGINTGSCVQAPEKIAIPGFPDDTLYLWTTAAPADRAC